MRLDQGPRHRDPLWARLTVMVGAVLMVLSGTAVVGARSLVDRYTADITQTTLIQGDSAGAGPAGNDISGALNVLLVGIDARPNGGAAQASVLSDTIVVLHIPASHDQAYLVSLPRDWRVQIPAYPSTGFAGGAAKINSAFSYGYQGPGTELAKRARGVDLLARTINSLTGIRFNGAALIDFQGFESVVHELGGVNLCVDQEAESIHLGVDRDGKILRLWYKEGVGIQGVPPGGRALVHKKGCRRMSAVEALDYARIRKSLPNGDYDRQRHQQQLIKAIAKEATSKGLLTDPARLSRVITAAGRTFVLDTQGVPIADFLFTLKGVAAHDLVLIKTNGGRVHSTQIGGVSFEELDATSLAMLSAARDGNLGPFLATHPEFIASSP